MATSSPAGASLRSRSKSPASVTAVSGFPCLPKSPPRRRHWKLAACALAVLGALAQPVWADGGASGGNSAAGGTDSATGPGGAGGTDGVFGAGGGGAGTIGGDGGDNIYGVGGAGGASAGADGTDGYAGGGGGGAHGAVVTTTSSSTGSIAGGRGGNGGAKGGDGGGGGAGGYGVVVEGSDLSYTVQDEIQGGNGGNGGSAPINYGGNAGSGGIGVDFTASGTLINNNTITAGSGGEGGVAVVSGNGASGGIGVNFTGSGALTNSGTITGGDGGAGGDGGDGGNLGLAPTSGNGASGGVGVNFMDSGSLTNSGTITGGDGGNGGKGVDASPGTGDSGGAGGAGGSGAAGVSAASGAALTNLGRIAGGNGGWGGGGGMGGLGTAVGPGGAGGNGGNGGNGGAGVSVGSGAILTNQSDIVGGIGGQGGQGGDGAMPGVIDEAAGGSGGVGGNGGSGGAAVSMTSGATLINSGNITGGDGGHAGGGGAGASGDPDGAYGLGGIGGMGGVGVAGAGISIVNSGSISGGMSADGLRQADAIQFTGGTNSLEIDPGSDITGTVDATASTSNTLILGGTTNSANPFDVSQIGSSQQYRGFTAFQKAGTNTWTLTNTTTAVTPWTLLGGKLAVSEDANLGDASGGLTFNGGTLEASRGFATSRAITLAGPGTIQSDIDASPLELDGPISGPGSLTATGEGTLALNHANTYQGGTNVYGDVNVLTSGALGTGPVTVQQVQEEGLAPILSFMHGSSAQSLSIHNTVGGATVFEDTSTAGQAVLTNDAQGFTGLADAAQGGQAQITNNAGGFTVLADQADAGSATITNNAGGTLLVGDAATAGGATVVNNVGGVVDISHAGTGTRIGSLSGAGDVYLGSKALTLGALNGNDTISGGIADGGDAGGTGGSLVKTGSGTLILDGVNTYTGGTTVQSGTLEVGDAATPTASILGDVQVDGGGTLRGHGTVGGDVTNSGLVWPGGSLGTLTIGGNYTQSPSGTLQMEVNPTAASQLKVGGTASLAGTLSLLYAPGTYTTKTYTLVSAGSVNGTFSTVTGNTPANVTQSVTYTPNEADLNLTGSGSVQPVVVAPTQATVFGAVGSSALRAGQGANEMLLDRLAGPCGVAAGGTATVNGQGAGAATSSSAAAQSLACPRQGNGLWIQAQGTDTRIDGNHGAPDVRDRRYGFLTGVDHQWKGWTVGVAGGYSHADVLEDGNGSKGTLDTLRIAGYGAKNLGAYTLAGTLGYAYDFSSTTRAFGALGSAKGDGHGQEITAGLQASRPWSLGPVVLTPRVGVRYAYLDGLGTDESGPTAQNLGVANQHLQSLQPYVGVTLDYPFTLRHSDRPASVQLRAGYAYETQSTGHNVSVTAADGTGFVIPGTRDTRGLVTVGLGATLPMGKSTSAYVRYDSVLHTGNVNAQSLQAGVDYRF